MSKKFIDLLYEKETKLIRDACYEVWREFGGAFKEKIVDRALTVALEKKGFHVETQKRIDIYFQGEKVGSYVPDKVVNDIILIEVKCKPHITREDERQFWLYLKGSQYKLGLLINFSPTKLEFRRRIYDKARDKELRR